MITLYLSILTLVYIYLAINEINHKRIKILYACCLTHVSIVGWLISDLSWTEPVLGLSSVAWLIVAGCVLLMRTPKFKTLLSPVLGCVSLLTTLALLSPKASSNPQDVQIWVSMHLFLFLLDMLAVLSPVYSVVFTYLCQQVKAKR